MLLEPEKLLTPTSEAEFPPITEVSAADVLVADSSGINASTVDSAGAGSSGVDSSGAGSSGAGSSGAGSSGAGSSGAGSSGAGSSGAGSSGAGSSGAGSSGAGSSGAGSSGVGSSGADSCEVDVGVTAAREASSVASAGVGRAIVLVNSDAELLATAGSLADIVNVVVLLISVDVTVETSNT